MERNNCLFHLVHGKRLRKKRKAFLFKGTQGIIQHHDCKPLRQKDIVFPPEILHIRARVMVAAQRIHVVSRKRFGDFLNHAVITVCACGNQISDYQRNIVFTALLQRARIYFHIVCSKPLATRIADYANRMHAGKPDDRFLYVYHFCIGRSFFFIHLYLPSSRICLLCPPTESRSGNRIISASICRF